MKKTVISLAALLMILVSTSSLSAAPSASNMSRSARVAVLYEDTSGSTTFFLNSATPVVKNWYYDAGKDELTVSVTLKGSLIGSAVLEPGNNSATISGTVTGDTAQLQVGANFNTHVMATSVSVSGVNGNRQTTGQGSF